MKNKKLFAILTLVCFMFTLMPVAAFAAEEEVSYDADQVYVYVDGEWVTEGDVSIKTPFKVAVGADTTVTTESYVFYALNEDGNGVALNRADGTMVIGVEGDYTVYAINVDGYDVEEVTGAIDTVANKVNTLVSWARGLGLIVDEYAEVSVEALDTEWTIELGGDAVQAKDANGNGIKVVMTLGSKVAVVNGEEVALDVALYVVNGRTVVPVGFITGTFGINPTFTYNADGTIADILFTK